MMALVQLVNQYILENVKKAYKRQMLNELEVDKGEHGNVELLKSIHVKTVIYIVAETWNQISKNVLDKLCPSV